MHSLDALANLLALLILGAIPILAVGGHLWHVWQVRRGKRPPDQAAPGADETIAA